MNGSSGRGDGEGFSGKSGVGNKRREIVWRDDTKLERGRGRGGRGGPAFYWAQPFFIGAGAMRVQAAGCRLHSLGRKGRVRGNYFMPPLLNEP